MTKIFISDLHLEESQPKITALFLNLLETYRKKAASLYILGDFFEVWIGDDNLTPFNQSIINALRKATDRGFPIFIMHGNRDFLLGKRFCKATGCRLLPDEHVIHFPGKPTLLMHGDILCTADKKYLNYRRKSRHWLFQRLFLCKSLEKRRLIAKRYREMSMTHMSRAPDHYLDVSQAEVMRLMKKHEVNYLIHGHTHRPATHTFLLNEKPATRTVLGAWHDGANALICQPNGDQEYICWHNEL